jgi:hypothetical protein
VADENTTDTQNSTTDQADQSQAASPATDSSTSTTTEQAVPTEKQAETILGTAADDDEKTDTGEKADEKTDAKGEDEKEAEPNALLGAPEGDYEITGLPEGTEVDKVALDALTPIAKEIGLSSLGMSKLAGVYTESILPHVMDTVVKDVQGQAAAQAKTWDAETRLAIEGGKDEKGNRIEPSPAFDGKPFAEVRAVAAKAIDRLAGEQGKDLREFLEASGLGNNLALVRFAYTAGKAIKEDDFVRADASSKAGPQTMAEVLYGKSE